MKTIIRLVLVSIAIMSLNFCIAYAEDVDQASIDAVTGPGVGLVENTSGSARIYGYGDTITGIDGGNVVEANAIELAPTYQASNIINPVDNYSIDKGPTSGYNANDYSLHSIDDGGPGTGIESNVYGTPVYYGGGPGIGLEQNNVNNGPSVIYSTANPENYNNYYNMTPGELAQGFNGGTKSDKIK